MLSDTTAVIEEALISALSVTTWSAIVFIVVFDIFFLLNSLANIIPIYKNCSTNSNISSQICNKISVVIQIFGVAAL